MAAATTILASGRRILLNARTYRVEQFIAVGGSGEVYRVKEHDRDFALKLFYPFYQLPLFTPTQLSGAITQSLDFQRREFDFLSSISHPNIVKVFDHGELILTKQEQKQLPTKDLTQLPILITEFVDGYPLNEVDEHAAFSSESCVRVLRRLAMALSYLHDEKKYLHMDIKPANVIVRKSDLEPILIDFALCKNLNFNEVGEDERTRLLGDWDLFPALPDGHVLKTIKESDGTRREISDNGHPYLDLFQFGKLLIALQPTFAKVFEDRELSYIDEMANQLTIWGIVTKWKSSDLTAKVDRLSPEHFCSFGVPELTAPTATEKTVMIPPGIGIPITKRVDQVLNSKSFRRLALINELGLVSYVYPGADYKRIVHVLYSYELARQLVGHLFNTPLFRVLFDKSNVQQLLAVTLLHDINHFPLLHVLQESQIAGLDRVEIIDIFCDGNATGERAEKQPSIYDLLQELGIGPDRFKKLVFGKYHEQTGSQGEIDQCISSIVNSGVDVDKLSYLFLDAHFTGILFGKGIDYQGILKAATVCRVRNGEYLHIAFGDRALQAAENVVLTRAWNFRSIYWHHTHRAIMAMILKVVRGIYGQKAREIREYVYDTMWLTDYEAIRYLDRKYRAKFGKASILDGIVEDRKKVYKRLFSVWAGMGDDTEERIWSELSGFNPEDLDKFCCTLAAKLKDFIRDRGHQVRVEADDIIVDIPRRRIDKGGEIYVVGSGRTVEPIENISEPVRSVANSYEKLMKRARIFINPMVYEKLSKKTVKGERAAIRRIVREALDEVRGRSQVQ